MKKIRQDYKDLIENDYEISPLAAVLILLAAFVLGMIYGVQL